MIRGLHLAASGMFAGQRQQEILTNNLSNAHTVGYKQDEAIKRSFPEMLIARIREEGNAFVPPGIPNGKSTPIGWLAGSVYTHEVVPSFIQGDLQETGRPYDFAIFDQHLAVETEPDVFEKLNVFFTVQGSNGSHLYTRDGRFTTDAHGYLVTPQGDFVLQVVQGDDGEEELQPIQITEGTFTVNAQGQFTVRDADGDIIDEGTLNLLALTLTDSLKLVKAERGYFQWQGEEELADQRIDLTDPNNYSGEYRIHQGAVEGSNVDVIKTMTDMMAVYRYYEANQKVLQAMDKTLEKAVNEIGRV